MMGSLSQWLVFRMGHGLPFDALCVGLLYLTSRLVSDEEESHDDEQIQNQTWVTLADCAAHLTTISPRIYTRYLIDYYMHASYN